MDVTAKELIRTSRKNLTNPSTWTQRALARDVSGKSVLFDDPSAVSFCVVGRLLVDDDGRSIDGFTDLSTAAIKILNAKILELYGKVNDELQVVEFNNIKTHEELMALMDQAGAE